MAEPSDTDSGGLEGSISFKEQLARDLYDAVDSNDLDRVRSLLGRGADSQHQLYWTSEWGWKDPPLHRACEKGYLQIVKVLIENGADKDVRDRTGCTPFLDACWGGHKNVIQYLVEEVNCHTDVRDQIGRTPLLLACQGNHNSKDVIQYLVEDLKCRVDVRDSDDMTPLDHAYDPDIALYVMNRGCTCDDEHKAEILCRACSEGKLDVVKELVEQHHINPSDARDEGRSPLEIAIDPDDSKDLVQWDVALYLVNYGCDDNKQKVELLCAACYQGKLDVIKELVEQHHVNPNVKDYINWTPLHHACHGTCRQKDVVEYLVEEANCDANVRDNEDDTPFHIACYKGLKDVVEYLVEKANCDIYARNCLDNTPLHIACQYGHKDIVEYLVEKANCDVRVRNRNNQTPLHKACDWKPDKDVVEYLVEKAKCDINVRDIFNQTLLHSACGCWRANLDVVKYLVEEKKCSVDVRDNSNQTPLHKACQEGKKDIAVYLMEKANCDTDVRDKNNQTPIHKACKGGHKDVVEYLVEKANCDIDVRDKDNQTPLHEACKGGNKTTVVYMVEKVRCDTDVRDTNSQTPLHKACLHGQKNVVKYLVEKGNSDINVTDDQGRTPFDLAKEKGHTAVTEYLEGRQKSAQQARRKRSRRSSGSGQSGAKKQKQKGSQPVTQRECPNCGESCHIRCKTCPECEHQFQSSAKKQAKPNDEPKKNPANLLQIMQKKMDQLSQVGYDVVVLVHSDSGHSKTNTRSRHTYREYCTPGLAESFVKNQVFYNSWKDFCKTNTSTTHPSASTEHAQNSTTTAHSQNKESSTAPVQTMASSSSSRRGRGGRSTGHSRSTRKRTGQTLSGGQSGEQSHEQTTAESSQSSNPTNLGELNPTRTGQMSRVDHEQGNNYISRNHTGTNTPQMQSSFITQPTGNLTLQPSGTDPIANPNNQTPDQYHTSNLLSRPPYGFAIPTSNFSSSMYRTSSLGLNSFPRHFPATYPNSQGPPTVFPPPAPRIGTAPLFPPSPFPYQYPFPFSPYNTSSMSGNEQDNTSTNQSNSIER